CPYRLSSRALFREVSTSAPFAQPAKSAAPSNAKATAKPNRNQQQRQLPRWYHPSLQVIHDGSVSIMASTKGCPTRLFTVAES
ncbi:MAG: hypothetical protein ACRD52_10590, partial [Candidatus Acidiferrales bacterium]